MILSDNETKIDMLNIRAIAKTVAEVIKEYDNCPISVWSEAVGTGGSQGCPIWFF